MGSGEAVTKMSGSSDCAWCRDVARELRRCTLRRAALADAANLRGVVRSKSLHHPDDANAPCLPDHLRRLAAPICRSSIGPSVDSVGSSYDNARWRRSTGIFRQMPCIVEPPGDAETKQIEPSSKGGQVQMPQVGGTHLRRPNHRSRRGLIFDNPRVRNHGVTRGS